MEVSRALTAQREQVAELQAATVVMGTEMERLAKEVARIRAYQETGTGGWCMSWGGGRRQVRRRDVLRLRWAGGWGDRRRLRDEGGD